MLLKPEIIRELTDRPQPAKQIEWLTRHGWVFEIGDSGRPKVSLSYYEQRMGGKPQTRQQQPRWDKV